MVVSKWYLLVVTGLKGSVSSTTNAGHHVGPELAHPEGSKAWEVRSGQDQHRPLSSM